MTWNHAFDFAFEVTHNGNEEGKDVSGETLRQHLLATIQGLSDDELKKSCNCFDTMESEKVRKQNNFGLVFRHTGYTYTEIENFWECADSIEPDDLRDRYRDFVRKLNNREIKKSTLVDRDVLIEFQKDLDNRANIDYREGHWDDHPDVVKGGKTFARYSQQLKEHLERQPGLYYHK